MSKFSGSIHRAVVALLLLSIAAAAAGTAATLLYSHATTRLWSGNGSFTQQQLQALALRTSAALSTHGGLVAGAALGILVLSLALLWLQTRALIQHSPRLVLSKGVLGQVAIHFNQIGLLAQREAEQIEGVREVLTTAGSTKAGIDVMQTIAVEPSLPFASLAEQVQQRVKQSLEFHLGFPVSRVQVVLQQASLSKSVL